MAIHAAFRTGSIFETCDDLLQTADAYSAEKKHRVKSVLRIVMVSVPQLVKKLRKFHSTVLHYVLLNKRSTFRSDVGTCSHDGLCYQ